MTCLNWNDEQKFQIYFNTVFSENDVLGGGKNYKTLVHVLHDAYRLRGILIWYVVTVSRHVSRHLELETLKKETMLQIGSNENN
jgi:hypothetical protein